MDAVPYEIREEDVDEVLGVYGAAAPREEAVRHVMRHARDIDEIVRTAPETVRDPARMHRDVVGEAGARPGDQLHDRRELALAAIEDLLIRDGYLDATSEERVFPIVRE
jgi:hypothetical protein